MADFYSHVPKDLEGNLQYRVDVRERARTDKGFRRAVVEACAEDVLYFLNFAAWLHEPRHILVNGKEQPHIIPFITWPHQDEVILKIRSALGQRDIGFDKSRGEGATWIMILLALQDWLFKRDVTIGVCSSTEDKTDIAGDRGTILGKLDWELTMLPTWMVGKKDVHWTRNRGAHKFENVRNSNLIVGYGAVAGTGRSNRYYWFFLDELGEWPQQAGDEVLASLQQATLSRAYVSTPMGPSGTYYDVMHRPSNMVRVTLDWRDNPTRNRGMYRLHRGVPVALDPVNNPLPPEYSPVSQDVREMFARLRHNGFKLEQIDRSPWYDWECDRSGSPTFIARELDRNFEGSLAQAFSGEFFATAEKSLMPPKYEGRLDIDEVDHAATFVAVDKGDLKIWCPLDARLRPPKKEYAIGADVGMGNAGAYTSNSTAEVFDMVSMEQVAEIAINWQSPADFAITVLGLCHFFWDAYVIWEVNYGSNFGKKIIDANYPHVYMRTRHDRRTKKKTKVVGWHTNKDTRQILFNDFDDAVRRGILKLRSKDLVYECSKYIMIDGQAVHAATRGSRSTNPGIESSHGDRVVGGAIGYQAIKDRPIFVEKTKDGEDLPREIPYDCMYTRLKMDGEQKEVGSWDGRSNWDLTRT